MDKKKMWLEGYLNKTKLNQIKPTPREFNPSTPSDQLKMKYSKMITVIADLSYTMTKYQFR